MGHKDQDKKDLQVLDFGHSFAGKGDYGACSSFTSPVSLDKNDAVAVFANVTRRQLVEKD